MRVRQYLLLAGLLCWASVQAQDRPGSEMSVRFPVRSIRFIIPYAPGGLPDAVARRVMAAAAPALGQPLVADNRPGAGGIAGSEAVAHGPADGYQLLVTDGSQITVNPYLYAQLPYDPVRDLVPISLLGASPLYLAVSTDARAVFAEARNLADLVRIARSRADIPYGSSGTGSTVHLAVEAFRVSAGIGLEHIPFKGSGPALQALLAGDTAIAMVAWSSVAGHVASGRLRLLGVSAPARTSLAPAVPTFIEQGHADFDFQPRIGVLAPAGTPAAVRERLAAALGAAARDPSVRESLAALGIEAAGSTPAEYAAVLAQETERFGRVVKAVGLRPN
jgi:tripartite-type tricarboxylate transporter receptor subunit TctC